MTLSSTLLLCGGKSTFGVGGLCSIFLPEGGKDAVSHNDAKAIDQRQLQTYVLEIIVGASQ